VTETRTVAGSAEGGTARMTTIGAMLKKSREQKRMSVTEVSRVTRIPVTTLDALEADRFDDLPGEVFVRGFLKSYAQAVGLAPSEVLARYTSSRNVTVVTPLPALVLPVATVVPTGALVTASAPVALRRVTSCTAPVPETVTL